MAHLSTLPAFTFELLGVESAFFSRPFTLDIFVVFLVVLLVCFHQLDLDFFQSDGCNVFFDHSTLRLTRVHGSGSSILWKPCEYVVDEILVVDLEPNFIQLLSQDLELGHERGRIFVRLHHRAAALLFEF